MDDAPAAASAAAVSASAAAWPSGAAAVISSSSASGLRRFVLNLPPGYHFLPTDAELVVHYLRPRLANQRLPLPIFFDEHILHYHPGRLVEKYREYGEDRWFFFVRRERKHEGGNRPNRATLGNGHWNATGSPRLIRAGGALVGRVRTLVFYEASRSETKKKSREESGKASKGAKTEWTMYEYESLAPEEGFVAACVDGNARMDAIVLCTIQKKKQKRHGEEAGKVGEAKKRTTVNRKAKGKGQEAGGGRKRRKRAAEPQEEDHVQRRTPTGREELLVQEQAFTGAADFTVDPDDDMDASCFLFANTSPPALPPPPPPQETMMMAAAAGGGNYTSVHPSTAATTSWQFQLPAVPLAHERVPYLDPKILAPLGGGNHCGIMAPNITSIMAPSITWMDLHFASTTDQPPPPLEELSWMHAPLRRRNEAKIVAPPVHNYGFGPGISSSSYGFAGGDTHRLSAGTGYRDLSRLSLPSQPSHGVGSAQGSAAASMVGSEEWRRPFSTQGSWRFLDPK